MSFFHVQRSRIKQCSFGFLLSIVLVLGGCTEKISEETGTEIKDVESASVPKAESLLVVPQVLDALQSLLGQGPWLSKNAIQDILSSACDRGDDLACQVKPWYGIEMSQRFETSQPVLKRLCEKGHWVACLGQGWVLSQLPLQPGSPSSEALGLSEAQQLFSKLCEKGNKRGCLESALIALRGPELDTGAMNTLKNLCLEKEQRACGFWIELQVERGATEGQRGQWYERAAATCGAGEPRGCRMKGLLRARGEGVIQSWTEAGKDFNKACNGGDMMSCRLLAEQYAKGRGVGRSRSNAAGLLERGCSGEEVMSCKELGLLYLAGKGVSQNAQKGNSYLEKACFGGVIDACTHLGWSYQEGRGFQASLERANELFQKSCAGGDMVGCGYLGWNLTTGTAGEAEQKEADLLLLKACDGEVWFACNVLGTRLEQRGISGSPPTQAFENYLKACRGYDVNGCKNLGRLAGSAAFAQKRPIVSKAVEQACSRGEKEACRLRGRLEREWQSSTAQPE